MRISRAERSLLADWWFTVDRVLLATILVIAGAGSLLSLAASPAIAIKRGLPTYHFVERHLVFSLLSVAVMLAVSSLSPRSVRRLALGVMIAAAAAMALVLLDGTEINGARRWLHITGHSLQPSEIGKPAFVVLSAWLLAEAERRPDVPATGLACLLYFCFAGLLVLQPDVGQALVVSLVWCALFLLAGRPLKWFLALAAAIPAGVLAAYAGLGYVRWRVDRFLNPSLGESFQTDRALQSFIEGGFFGKGPGEGTIKTVLPDARSDFIFAVIAEEYGTLACLVILGLFALVALRAFSRGSGLRDGSVRLAGQGLALLFALQAVVNMAVNVGLVPAKGITLPFISSGGSSMLGMGLAMGMLLALTRRSPDRTRVERSGFAPGRRAGVGAAGSWPS
jgi:cell division protein FtsW